MRDEATFIVLSAFLFSALTLNAQVIQINQTFSSDTAFNPFSGSQPVYSLRIDIINASIGLDSLKLDTNYLPNALEMQAQAKWEHDSIKIVIMNQRIVEEHMYWRAGRNEFVNMFFQSKETIFGNKYSLHGFDYYIGGIFEFFLHRATIAFDNS